MTPAITITLLNKSGEFVHSQEILRRDKAHYITYNGRFYCAKENRHGCTEYREVHRVLNLPSKRFRVS